MLMERVKIEVARAERMDRPMTLALLDVDLFKAVNDAHGHESGDKALIELSQAIQSGIRDYDIGGRLGGEEFMIIMPEIGMTEAVVVGERVRKAIAGLDLKVGDIPLT